VRREVLVALNGVSMRDPDDDLDDLDTFGLGEYGLSR
jgi:hypothetical protein